MIKNNIVPRAKLAKILCNLRKGMVVVFTNGCFDILHKGHVKYLEDAKNLGDILIVAINSDSSIKAIKGKGRPINKLSERAFILSRLKSVDFVTVFHETTPKKTIKLLRPDILVKGSDWKKENIVGKGFVESCGGKVARIKFLKGYSTTSLINKISKIKKQL